MLGEQRILSQVRKAVEEYHMIQEGDCVGVGVSGGKDSLTLLYALAQYRRFAPFHFDLHALCIDAGFQELVSNGQEHPDYSGISSLCQSLNVPLHIKQVPIAQVVFEERQESNPCSLCSKMRRGALNAFAVECGCNRIALGHHMDDVVETFMMNLFFEGRLASFCPVTIYETSGTSIIRPLIFVPEKDIRYFATHAELPIVKSSCPADKKTEREEMKTLLRELSKKHKGLKHRILLAIQKHELDGFHQ